MLMAHMDSDENENMAVQSEFGFKHFNFESLDDRFDELRVSDRPHLDPDQPVYENTSEPIQPKIRVRRSSAGDEATLICDFGDFKTQELLTRPGDFSPAPSLTSFQRGGRSQGKSIAILNYSTNSESYHGGGGSSVSYPRSIPEHSVLQRLTTEPPTSSSSTASGGIIYQNYVHPANRGVPPVMPKPVRPFAPAMFNPSPVNQAFSDQGPPPGSGRFSLKSASPPRVPPKQSLPPPYRPPPFQNSLPQIPRSSYQPLYSPNGTGGAHQPLQTFFMPPIEEDATGTTVLMNMNPLTVQINRFDRHPMLGLTTTTGTHSSSDGGSHDSHNDSGYCAVRIGGSSAAGSGGPSPSLSGWCSLIPGSLTQKAPMGDCIAYHSTGVAFVLHTQQPRV